MEPIKTITREEFLKANPKQNAWALDICLSRGERYYIGFENSLHSCSVLWADLEFVKKNFKFDESGLNQESRLQTIDNYKNCLKYDCPVWMWVNRPDNIKNLDEWRKYQGGYNLSESAKKMFRENISWGLYQMYEIQNSKVSYIPLEDRDPWETYEDQMNY